MIKKYFLFSFLLPLFFVSLFIITPSSAHAGLLEMHSSLMASIGSFFNSLFSTVKSTVTSVTSLFTKDNKETSSGLIQANCIPPVPPKPTGIDSGSQYGSLTVTPEVSTAGPNNIITISASTNLDPTWGIGFTIPVETDENDLIDWNPKFDSSVIRFSQHTVKQYKDSPYYSPGTKVGEFGSYGWGVVNTIKPSSTLPTSQAYWVKLRTRNSTIPERAKNATNAHGWRKVSYSISNPSKSGPGTQGIYIGREQKPSLITIIPNYSPTAHTLEGGANFLKPFTVVPNEYFEIQTKSLGQPGTITMEVKYGKILGDTKRHVKADETITWKIQPLRIGPVLLRELSLVNTCGEDYFIDPAQTARLSELDHFKFPVAYDFEKLTSDMVDLSVGARNPDVSSLAVDASYETSFPIFSSLFTKGETKIPVPDVPITFRAVYKDNQTETAKNLIFRLHGQSGKESAGEVTINTLKDSTGIGSAFVVTLGSKLTAADAKRGIIIRTTSSRFPGLSAEMTVPLVVPKSAAPQPKPPAPIPTPKPTPPEQSKKVLPHDLTISSDRTLTELKEGDKVIFMAKLVMSDGSTRLVATNLTWSVVGKIGSITPSGVFTAELDPLLAEYGEGLGSIVVVYKNADGKEFLAQTPIFKVEASVEQGFDDTQG